MKKIYLSVFLVFIAIAAKCQTVTTDVTDNFPLTIVMKVQDVVLAANVATSEQVPLANFFQTEATSIANAVNSNASDAALQVVQNQLITQFQAILSAQELALYSANRPGSVYALVPPATPTQ